MKITTRLVVSLLLVSALVATLFSFLQAGAERARLAEDLDKRAVILADSFQEQVREGLSQNSPTRLARLVKKFSNRDRLAGIALYDAAGNVVASTKGLIEESAAPREVILAIGEGRGTSGFKEINGRRMHVYAEAVLEEEKPLGAIAVFHDSSYIDVRVRAIWQNNFIRLLILSLLITVTTMVVVRWSVTGPIADLAEWLKVLRTGGKASRPYSPKGDILGPLAAEAAQLAKSLASARAAAEEEAKLRVSTDSLWTAERLKEHIKSVLGERNLFVVSNREPYMHVRRGRSVECIIPAGGVVTALDPIMRACGGMWVAHGSGDADFESSDASGKLRVPPDEGLYTLKRIWLTKEEEEGYYYAFSNEGLWPLCHITHTRPLFRLQDWICYQEVNAKFAEAVLKEIEGTESPLVLVQDYHFALLPLLIKSKRPDARVGIFWHIPWPNPEVFGICPWKEEILLGLLGADLVGFQTQFYCNNFLETTDRFLESKIDWDQFSVERKGQRTFVKPFPISVDFNLPPGPRDGDREALLREFNINSRHMGVGVDRIDYTKGIVERFRAVERFLEKHPDFIGRFTFVELGAPSRTLIQRYHDLTNEVEATADKINWRFQTGDWKPIVFLKDHHRHDRINRFYRAADLCMVTSLHDGMNLVAKEFIASRDDGEGVLILSQFAGASRELRDALIVNPYDIEDMAEAINSALSMPTEERKERMRNMRATVRERNIYRWAASLVTELSRVRV